MRDITMQARAEGLPGAGAKLESDLTWVCVPPLAPLVSGQVAISLTLGLSFKWGQSRLYRWVTVPLVSLGQSWFAPVTPAYY